MCPHSRSDVLVENLWKRVNSSQADQSHLKEAFSLLDRDGDGQISPSDLKAFFESCSGSGINEEEITAMMGYADADGNGRVDFTEFENLLSAETDETGSTPGSPYLEHPSLQEVFGILDQDGDGVLSKDDLERFVRKSGYRLSQEELGMMLEAAASATAAAPNHSVCFEDFVGYFMI